MACPPECRVVFAAAAVVSLRAGPGRLAGESGEAPNEKLEHQVPPTRYSHTDTCSNCMQPTASERRSQPAQLVCYRVNQETPVMTVQPSKGPDEDEGLPEQSMELWRTN
ncbi:hypothetical protein EYF80_019626 [Liparis tanakae]|uniref:Uncharacterized protein n=1 Tax=Liparis tanakae TaxID=230148 RepID=A0A4Z2HWA0_9TELE|nr:hypothetical protein EYF80_019626 [Liparis tanakae]